MCLEKIRNIRKQQGLSQKKLAELSNLSRSTIINFETDKRDPRVGDLQKIANALEVRMEELI